MPRSSTEPASNRVTRRRIASNPSSARARLTPISYNHQLRDRQAALAAERTALPDCPQILEAPGATHCAAGKTRQAVETPEPRAGAAAQRPFAVVEARRRPGGHEGLRRCDLASARRARRATKRSGGTVGAGLRPCELRRQGRREERARRHRETGVSAGSPHGCREAVERGVTSERRERRHRPATRLSPQNDTPFRRTCDP